MTPDAANQTATTMQARPERLLGLDLFRTVAIFGMLVAHVGPASWTPDGGFGQVHWEWEAFHSRMPAMFAFAAGLSLNLSSQNRGQRGPATTAMLVRAGLLLGCGLGLMALGTPVVVILGSFAVFFVLVIPFLRLGTTTIMVTAAAWALAGPPLSFALRTVWPDRDDLVWSVLVSGDYPALTWMPFILAGVAIGRLDLTAGSVRRRLAATGAGLAIVAYGGSALLMGLVGRAAIVASLPDAQPAEFARRFFAEHGVTDTGSWWWVVSSAPHSGSWGDVLGSLGVCLLLLAVLLPVGDWAARSDGDSTIRRAGTLALRWLAAPGAMVLSVYALHIVVMWAASALSGHSFAPAQPVWILVAFCVGLCAFAVVWSRRRPQGPLEALMSRSSRLVLSAARTGTRSIRGSSRR